MRRKSAVRIALNFKPFVQRPWLKRIKAEYQQQTTGAQETQYEMLKKLELSREQFVDF